MTEQSLRLLLCTYQYPPSLGGVEKQSHLLASTLVARGHEVRVLTTGRPAKQILDGVFVERLSKGGPGAAAMMEWTARLVTRVSFSKKPDLVHVQQLLPPAAALALACKPRGIPLVASNRGSGPKGNLQVLRSLPMGGAGVRALRLASGFIAMNSEMLDEMEAAGLRGAKLIRNGVEVPQSDERLRAEARQALGLTGTVVLFLGRLVEEKQPLVALQAFAKARTPDSTLVIAGDGPLLAALKEAAQPLGDSVRILGETRDTARLLRAADLFLQSSHTEGQSNALLEAAAHGLAPVVTDIAASREVLGDTGVLVQPFDAAALGKALRPLLEDPRKAKAIGEAARARVAKEFGIDQMVDAHLELYRTLV